MVRQERADQRAAAQDHQIPVQLLLEPGHGLGGVAGEQGGVLPRQRLSQRARHQVFLRVIEHLGVRVVGPAGPDAVEIFVGPAAQQQPTTPGAVPGHALRHPLGHDGILVRPGPAAIAETITTILVRAGRGLHHAVQGHVVEHHQLAHRALLPETPHPLHEPPSPGSTNAGSLDGSSGDKGESTPPVGHHPWAGAMVVTRGGRLDHQPAPARPPARGDRARAPARAAESSLRLAPVGGGEGDGLGPPGRVGVLGEERVDGPAVQLARVEQPRTQFDDRLPPVFRPR